VASTFLGISELLLLIKSSENPIGLTNAPEEPEPVAWTVGEVVDALGTSIPNPPPECQHGHILKQGISKGGKPYYGYVCKSNVKEDAVWASMSPNGRWYFKGDE
jgi:hypothetical protein